MSRYTGVYISRSEERREMAHPTRKPTYSAMYLPNGELTEIGKKWVEQQKEKGERSSVDHA